MQNPCGHCPNFSDKSFSFAMKRGKKPLEYTGHFPQLVLHINCVISEYIESKNPQI